MNAEPIGSLNLATHPIKSLLRLARIHRDLVFYFGSYVTEASEYGNHYTDRELFSMHGQDLETKLPGELENYAAKKEDVVVHSLVTLGSVPFGTLHIPMIDFTCDPRFLPQYARDNYTAVTGFHHNQLEVYSSGRSMHGYGLSLLDQAEWIQYMGSLLLLNQTAETAIDSRWVGHALQKGYGALRLTCNHPHYLQVPQAIPNPFENPYGARSFTFTVPF